MAEKGNTPSSDGGVLSICSKFATDVTYSLRLYPHLQDTGGFFVAVLQKADDPVSDGLQQSEGIKEGSGAANEEDTTTLRQAEQEDHKPGIEEDPSETGIEEDPSETGIEEASSVLER